MRPVRVAIFAIALCSSVAVEGSAQIAATEIGDLGFFSSAILTRIQKSLSPTAVLGDKNKPRSVALPDGFGQLYEFQRNNKPMVVIVSEKPLDVGAKVLLPSGEFGMDAYVAIYSREEAILTPDDFPIDLRQQFATLWPSGQIRVHAAGFTVRAIPSGRAIYAVRQFFRVNRIDGSTVVAFEKSRTLNTTGVMIFGTLSQPFGIGISLESPLLAVTKLAGKPNPTVAVASVVRIGRKQYNFKAEGSKLTAPDIFLLKTTKLEPQDLADLGAAFGRALFDRPVNLFFRFSQIPTFSIGPARSYSTRDMTDRDSVVVFAAIAGANNTDWNIKGPGLTIRGSLHIDVVQQDVGYVQALMDQDSFSATFAAPTKKVPGMNVELYSAKESIEISESSASMTMTGDFLNGCLGTSIFSFTINAQGIATPDLSANPALAQFTPTSLFERVRQCGYDGVQGVSFALETGGWLLNMGKDKLLDAAVPVFGASNVAIASKAASYPLAVVGGALGKVLPTDKLLTLADSVWGSLGIGGIAAGAGRKAEEVMRWANGKGIGPEAIGYLLGHKLFPRNDVMNGAVNVFTGGRMAVVANAAGYATKDVFEWGKSAGKSASDVAAMANKVFPTAAILDNTSTIYNFSDEQVAKVAQGIGAGATEVAGWLDRQGVGRDEAIKMMKGAGYVASEISSWLQTAGLSGKEVINALGNAGFSKSEIKGAVMSVYSWSSSAFEDAWGSVCKTFTLGLAKC